MFSISKYFYCELFCRLNTYTRENCIINFADVTNELADKIHRPCKNPHPIVMTDQSYYHLPCESELFGYHLLMKLTKQTRQHCSFPD